MKRCIALLRLWPKGKYSATSALGWLSPHSCIGQVIVNCAPNGGSLFAVSQTYSVVPDGETLTNLVLDFEAGLD